MKLPYLPVRGILKPVVEVVILGPRKASVHALIDSGADFCIFDDRVTEYVGVEFEPQLHRNATGIGGTLRARGAWVDLMVARRRLRMPIFFAPNLPINLLGRDDFFRIFHVCFDERAHELELRFRRAQPR